MVFIKAMYNKDSEHYAESVYRLRERTFHTAVNYVFDLFRRDFGLNEITAITILDGYHDIVAKFEYTDDKFAHNECTFEYQFDVSYARYDDTDTAFANCIYRLMDSNCNAAYLHYVDNSYSIVAPTHIKCTLCSYTKYACMPDADPELI